MSIRYPNVREQLLALVQEDQKQVRSQYQLLLKCTTPEEKYTANRELAYQCHVRAERMSELLLAIHNKPTISNVGIDGSQAISVLALHAYLELMKKILALYEQMYKKDPNDIYYQAIPPLTDRIMIIEKRQQRFGTNWFTDAKGDFFLVQLEDFKLMNRGRARYGLEPAQKPRILAYGAQERPLGEGLATEHDQKQLSDEEYKEYAQFQSENLVKDYYGA